MKKAVVLVLVMALSLVGCASDVALVGEAVKNHLDLTSVETETTLSVDSDFNPDDGTMGALLETLRGGVVIRSQQKDRQTYHATLALKDANAVKDRLPFAVDPIDVYVVGENLYLKSAADDKYLGLPADEGEGAGERAARLTDALKAFVDQYDVALPNVTEGKETLALRDGGEVETTRVHISLGFQEALDVAAATLDNLSRFDRLGDMLAAADAFPSDDIEAELGDARRALAEAAQTLKGLSADELRQNGWNAGAELTFWVGPNHQLVKDEANVTLAVPGDVLGVEQQTVNVNVHLASMYWKHNQPVQYPVPSAGQVVSVDQLVEQPDLLQHFAEASPIRHLAESFLVTEAEPPFVDVPENHWAFIEIATMKELGMIGGYGDNTFRPNQPVTRAEFVKMVVYALDLEPVSTPLPFKDKNQVPVWAVEPVQTAVQAGLIKGYNDGTLRPNKPITRDEVVAVLVRALELPESSQPLTFKDAHTIPAWAVPAVRTAAAHGLVAGYPDGTFAPKKLTTRAEAVALLYRALMADVPTE